MNEPAKVRVYIAEPWVGLQGVPFLVVATQRNERGYQAEWWPAIPDGDNTLFDEEISGPPDVTAHTAAVTEMLILRSAIDAARRKLTDYLERHGKSLTKLPAFEEDSIALFTYCYLNDQATDQLKTIYSRSEIDEIATAIRMAQAGTSKLRRRDLSGLVKRR